MEPGAKRLRVKDSNDGPQQYVVHTGADQRPVKEDRWASDTDEETKDEPSRNRGRKVAPMQPQLSAEPRRNAQVESKEEVKSAVGVVAGPQRASQISKSVEVDAYNPLVYGCRSVEIYEPVGRIDEGTYGVVFKARNTISGEIVALKQIKFGSSAPREGFPMTALRETNILLSLRHPNIVRVKEMVMGSSFDKVFMVMEYMDMDLKSVIERRKFTLSETKRLMLQLLSAMEYMHRCWYIHRDLKTSNLLYNKRGKLAVCDFGFARKYGSPIVAYTQLVVTLWYRAPELLLGAREYSTPIDMWSVGCILAELLRGGEPLFPGQGEADQVDRIFKAIGAPTEERWPGCTQLPNIKQSGSWRWPAPSKLREKFPRGTFGDTLALSDVGYELLSRLLEMNPANRITAEEALRHPWFSEHPLPTPEDMMPGIPQKR